MAKAKAFKVDFLDDWSIDPVEAWPTGSALLDWLSGIGGIPKGRVVECYGEESSGKSTFGLQVASATYKATGLPSIYVDFEDALDMRYVAALGLGPESLLLPPPGSVKTLEDFISLCSTVLEKGPEVALIICDSVAAAITEANLTAEAGDRTAGMDRARVWTQNLPRLTKGLSATGTTLWLVNQTRVYIDTSGGFVPPGMKALQPKKVRPGGKGIKFYDSLAIEFEPSSDIREVRTNPLTREEENTKIGRNVWLTVTKNKVAPPPWRRIRLQIRDGIGFDDGTNLLEFGLVHGVITKGTQGRYSFDASLFADQDEDWVVGPSQPFTGEQMAAAAIRSNPDLRDAIASRIFQQVDAAESAEELGLGELPESADEEE